MVGVICGALPANKTFAVAPRRVLADANLRAHVGVGCLFGAPLITSVGILGSIISSDTTAGANLQSIDDLAMATLVFINAICLVTSIPEVTVGELASQLCLPVR